MEGEAINFDDPKLFWWGYSKEHGWVLLDRTIAPNKSGWGADLLFLRCSDTETLVVERKYWEDDSYFVYAPRYMSSLSKEEMLKARNDFDNLKQKSSEFHQIMILKHCELIREEVEKEALKQKEYIDSIIEKHKEFLLDNNVEYAGVVIHEYGAKRVGLCVFCNDSENRLVDIKCMSCEWSICECGACGCGLRALTIKNHIKFLVEKKITYQGTRITSVKRHRKTHCYNCKTNLDNSVDIECEACGWIICNCGACGCGFTSQKNKEVVLNF